MTPPHSQFRMILTAASAAVGGSLAWWLWRTPALAVLAIILGALLLLALSLPRAYAPVFRILDGIVRATLHGFTWLLLGVVFVLVFVPGRLVLAVRRRDPLERRPDPTRVTYWHELPRTQPDPAVHFRRTF